MGLNKKHKHSAKELNELIKAYLEQRDVEKKKKTHTSSVKVTGQIKDKDGRII